MALSNLRQMKRGMRIGPKRSFYTDLLFPWQPIFPHHRMRCTVSVRLDVGHRVSSDQAVGTCLSQMNPFTPTARAPFIAVQPAR